MKLSQHIFRMYDIRGIVDEDFDEEGGKEKRKHPNEPRRPIRNWKKVIEENMDALDSFDEDLR